MQVRLCEQNSGSEVQFSRQKAGPHYSMSARRRSSCSKALAMRWISGARLPK